jgi:Holliday junction resolvase RusA-like endonuclease
MAPLAFSVTIDPRGKGRPRTAVRGNHATIYTDSRTRAYEAKVRGVAEKAMAGAPPLEGPLAVSLRFRLPIPVSYSKKRRAAILAGQEPFYGQFDADNLGKALLDAFNAVVFVDDKQITQLMIIKTPAERGGVDIHITPISGAAA